MIDRNARNQLAEAGRQLVTGRITTRRFERLLPDFDDPAIEGIWEYFDCLYDDVWPVWPHRLRGRRRPSAQERRTAARAVLFLHSGFEFDPAGGDRRFDEVPWPFATHADFEQAKRAPRLLSGRSPGRVRMRPLTCPGLAESRPTLVERVGLWIPLLGWSAACMAERLRFEPYVWWIRKQLSGRPAFPASAWGADEARLAFARWLCRTVRDEIGWPNDRFLPDDPVRLAFWAHRDGLDINFLMLEIEQEVGVEISDADCQRLEGMTMGQAVDFLIALKA